MDLYRVELTKSAAKEIKKLQRDDQKRVVKALGDLRSTPRPRGVEKLKENPSFYRIKVGRDLRIVYLVADEERLVVIALIRDRKDAYRGIADLDPDHVLANIETLRAQLQPPGPRN